MHKQEKQITKNLSFVARDEGYALVSARDSTVAWFELEELLYIGTWESWVYVVCIGSPEVYGDISVGAAADMRGTRGTNQPHVFVFSMESGELLHVEDFDVDTMRPIQTASPPMLLGQPDAWLDPIAFTKIKHGQAHWPTVLVVVATVIVVVVFIMVFRGQIKRSRLLRHD